ncbi:hypothetical protein DPMN_175985 [Dreissena polymorpha]|uniref:Uncharacterized protein n=1 Tax=Dreissena polymorpha TaxID=45954 RepID=A0A9D4IK49_DREPO|nr:hypothetical protein DPMN_175985 [Dreissena polymorpha]
MYKASVQLCNNVRCLSPIHSKAFTIELEAPDISFIKTELILADAGECVDFQASWQIIGQSDNVAFYQWSVSRDAIGGQLLSVWENVRPNGTVVKVIVISFIKMTLSFLVKGDAYLKEVDIKQTMFEWMLFCDKHVIYIVHGLKQVAKCVVLPGHGHLTSFLCVRVFSVSGLAKTSCQKMNKGESGSYSKTSVYDFDSSSVSWVVIKKVNWIRY